MILFELINSILQKVFRNKKIQKNNVKYLNNYMIYKIIMLMIETIRRFYVLYKKNTV